MHDNEIDQACGSINHGMQGGLREGGCEWYIVVAQDWIARHHRKPADTDTVVQPLSRLENAKISKRIVRTHEASRLLCTRDFITGGSQYIFDWLTPITMICIRGAKAGRSILT